MCEDNSICGTTSRWGLCFRSVVSVSRQGKLWGTHIINQTHGCRHNTSNAEHLHLPDSKHTHNTDSHRHLASGAPSVSQLKWHYTTASITHDKQGNTCNRGSSLNVTYQQSCLYSQRKSEGTEHAPFGRFSLAGL